MVNNTKTSSWLKLWIEPTTINDCYRTWSKYSTQSE